MKKRPGIPTLLKLTLLFVALGAAGVYFLARQNIDLRFYRWLDSRSGRTVAQIMGWSADFELPPIDKPEEEMSEDEIALKRSLEAKVASNLPTHRIKLTNGQVLTGRITAQTESGIRFVKSFGGSGGLAATIRRDRIIEMEDLAAEAPRIFHRDVTLAREFPRFEFHKRPPYTVLTDENYFRVRRSVQTLSRLHGEFTKVFGSLITQPERGQAIQLLFFKEEKQYSRYADRYAPQLENTSGFYSPKIDRLTVYNQITSDQLRKAKRELIRKEKRLLKEAQNDEAVNQIKLWRSDADRSIQRYAEDQIQYTLRHEGAHQLFFTYGIHSTHHAENTWLIEGLSVYCEAGRIGDRIPERVALLKKYVDSEQFIDIDRLVSSRSRRGLFVFGKDELVKLAYSESWVLVHFLMQPKYRNDFFAYITYIRDPAHVDDIALRPRLEIIASFIGLSDKQLAHQWSTYVRRM